MRLRKCLKNSIGKNITNKKNGIIRQKEKIVNKFTIIIVQEFMR